MPGPYQIEINKALAPVAAVVSMVGVFFLSAGLSIGEPLLAAAFAGLIAFAIGYVSTGAAAVIIVIGSVFLYVIISSSVSNSPLTDAGSALQQQSTIPRVTVLVNRYTREYMEYACKHVNNTEDWEVIAACTNSPGMLKLLTGRDLDYQAKFGHWPTH
jgi:hypothetical protein